MKVKDCIAIVTGGASGLGEATVRHLSGNGARVAIFDIQADKGKALAKEIGNNVLFVNVDVTSEDSVSSGIEKKLLIPLAA